MIRGKTLQLRLGENINVPKISGSPIRNTDCRGENFRNTEIFGKLCIVIAMGIKKRPRLRSMWARPCPAYTACIFGSFVSYRGICRKTI